MLFVFDFRGGILIKTIQVEAVTKTVAKLCQEANFFLGEDVLDSIKMSLENETSLIGKDILKQLLQNSSIASQNKVPICQDTGFAVIFLSLGQEVNIVGGDLYEAIQEGVRRGYTEGYLRKSIVSNPFQRINTNDNTPAIIHTKIVPGDKLKIVVAPKGGGSENMSALQMLKPSQGVEGVKDFVLDTVKLAGPNPCPPIVVGIGIGGTMEKVALLAKEALLRPLGKPNEDLEIANLEKELLTKINALGIGPQGLGGRTTCLAVHINVFPCHMATLPVAVNLNCHAARHKEAFL